MKEGGFWSRGGRIGQNLSGYSALPLPLMAEEKRCLLVKFSIVRLQAYITKMGSMQMLGSKFGLSA
jgi:hypothetical protein